MPVKIWNRGKKIAVNGAVEIQYVDNTNQEVDATVFGTHPYGVTVGADPEADFCECPFFPGNGYCKHIAAVVDLLKAQQRPVEKLFDRQSDDLTYEKNNADYLARSQKFETLLNENPQHAAAIYADKSSYDLLRADPTAWAGLVDPDEPAPAPQPPVLTTQLEQPQHILEQFKQQQPPKKNGERFLANLALPRQHYFKPLQAATDAALTLEVTLVIADAGSNWEYDFEKRFFIKMRLAAAEGKFYVISDIPRFLTAYQLEQTYQTNGKREFDLTHAAFSTAEQALLEFLGTADNEVQIVSYGSGKGKYFALPSYNLPQAVALLNKLPHFEFRQVEEQEQPGYTELTLRQLQAADGLLSGELTAEAGGYALTLTSNFQEYVPANRVFVQQATLFQATRAQIKIITELINNYVANTEYSDSSQLHFPSGSEAQLSDFIAYFKQVGVLNVPAQLTISAMTPHFSLRKNKHNLELQLAYEYAGQVINSATIAQQPAVQRNLAMEQQAQDYLRSLDFQLQGQLWVREFPQAAALYRFFTQELPNLRANGVVDVTADLQALLHHAAELKPAVKVTTTAGFLAVNFSLNGIGEREVDTVLQQLDTEQPYVTRTDGSLILVDAHLKKVAVALRQLRHQGKLQHGQIKVHAAQALAVQAVLGDTATFDQKFQRLTQDLAHPEKFPVIPKPVQAKLRPYQKVGIQWLEMLDSYGFGGILADEMGLGKTLQLIGFINDHLVAGQTHLIVSPASLIYNWQEEFHKFTPAISVKVVDGSKEHRRQLINNTDATILITSYNSARLDIAEYQQRKITYLVLDEAQYVKNASSKTNQNLRQLTPQNTFALSGTPIENRAAELWAIFELVMPGLLPSKKAFNQLSPAEIAARVKPFILRREKATVLKDIPAKVESNLYNEMTKAQKTVYLAQLKQMQVKIKGMTSANFVKNKIAILAGLTRLRQICDTPALYLDDYRQASGKLEQLKEILRQAQANQRHVLIFSQFTSMLDLIETELAQQGIATFMLQGSTKPKARLAMVDAFNAGAKNVFLISLKAGGTGLNLTGADMVILVDLWWNPAVEDQATARAHRIGQKKTVEVFRLITKGTIEEQIYKLQEKKRNFVDQVLSGTENKGTLTEAEVRSILGITAN